MLALSVENQKRSSLSLAISSAPQTLSFFLPKDALHARLEIGQAVTYGFFGNRGVPTKVTRLSLLHAMHYCITN
jgi:hypothetical protein